MDERGGEGAGIHHHPKGVADDSYPAYRLATYTCSMHPEIQQRESGNCPKCGMAL